MTFTDFGQATGLAFMGDIGDREHILPGGAQVDDSATWGSAGDYTITINDADVNAAETSITVVALPVALPDNTELNFGGTVAKLSAAAEAGATSITVDALTADIANGLTATYDADTEVRILPAGTLVGRTTAEKLNGDPFGPYGDSDNEIYILAEDVDLEETPDCNLVRHGSMIKYNFLPSWTGSSSTAKAALHASYEIVKG